MIKLLLKLVLLFIVFQSFQIQAQSVKRAVSEVNHFEVIREVMRFQVAQTAIEDVYAIREELKAKDQIKFWNARVKLYMIMLEEYQKSHFTAGQWAPMIPETPKVLESYEALLPLDSLQQDGKYKDYLPDFEFITYELANKYISDGKTKFALDMFEYTLGASDLLHIAGKSDESQYASKEPHAELVFTIANLAYQLNFTDKAKAYYEQLYAAHYHNAKLYEMLFRIYEHQDPEKAEKYLHEGEALFPENVSLIFDEVLLLEEKGEWNEVINVLQRGIDSHPDDIQLYLSLGDAYRTLYFKEPDNHHGYFTLAVDTYKKVIEIDPENTMAYSDLGILYFERGKYQSSYSEANQIRDYEEAMKYLQVVEAKNPNHIYVLIALKGIFDAKGEAGLSAEFYARLKVVQNGGINESSYFTL